MRQIKFRVWDKRCDYGILTDDECHFYISPNGKVYDVNDGEDITEYVELMQYAGLKDKNGVEIYEGDLMASDSYGGQIMEVRWNNNWGFYLHDYNDNIDDHLNTEEMTLSEIVGNKYENSVLVEINKH
jgi:uncharacterized phage protein (TIGR01671 family)